MADMTKDIFAEQSYGALALRKMSPIHSNFRLYQAGWEGDKGAEVMKVTGAVFRAAKAGPDKGKLSIMVPGTRRTTFVTREEMLLFARRKALGAIDKVAVANEATAFRPAKKQADYTAGTCYQQKTVMHAIKSNGREVAFCNSADMAKRIARGLSLEAEEREKLNAFRL